MSLIIFYVGPAPPSNLIVRQVANDIVEVSWFAPPYRVDYYRVSINNDRSFEIYSVQYRVKSCLGNNITISVRAVIMNIWSEPLGPSTINLYRKCYLIYHLAQMPVFLKLTS